MKDKNLIIRSTSAEFLIFEQQKKEKGIEVRFEDGDLWLTQKLLGELFDTTRNNITMHLQEIYNSDELDENSTSKDFLLVQEEGNREVKRNVKYYNLDVIISVGYRVNSDRAIQFRRWATNILKFEKVNRKPTLRMSPKYRRHLYYVGLHIYHSTQTELDQSIIIYQVEDTIELCLVLNLRNKLGQVH